MVVVVAMYSSGSHICVCSHDTSSSSSSSSSSRGGVSAVAMTTAVAAVDHIMSDQYAFSVAA